MKITLKFPDKEAFTCDAPQWATIEEIIEPYKDQAVYPIYLARVGNDIRDWDPTHKRMTRGVTLRVEEAKALSGLLMGRQL